MTSSASISGEAGAESLGPVRLFRPVSWEDGTPVVLRCPACGCESPCPKILSVTTTLKSHVPFALHLCPECRSHFYDPIPDITYSARYSEAASLYALLQGTSLEFALAALSTLTKKEGQLLDVGCGPGLVVDFWERLHLGVSTGIEPSSSGNFARQDLHRNIRVLHLSEDSELPDHAFDVVLSTEVVEHVSDPALFLCDLSKKVAPGGVLIFSTPNIGPLARDLPAPSNLVEALSPGFHVTLFSEAALRSLLAALDWPHVQLIDHHGHWIVYASREPITSKMDLVWVDEAHRKYLEHAAKDGALSPRVRAIFSYRLFRKIANEGRWPEANPLLPHLAHLLPSMVASWALHPDDIVETGAIPDDTLREWVAEFYHLPAFLFLLGIRSKNHLGKTKASVQFFKLACRLSKLMVFYYLDDAYTKEIFWESRLNAGIALLESAQESEGITLLEQVGASLQDNDTGAERLLPQLKFATRAWLAIFQHRVLRGNWEAAGLALSPLQGFLASHYDPSLLRISAWSQPERQWPEEWSPFWYFFCEQMLLLNTGRNAEAAEGFDQLHTLCREKVPHPDAVHLLSSCRRHAKLARQRVKGSKGFLARFRFRLHGI